MPEPEAEAVRRLDLFRYAAPNEERGFALDHAWAGHPDLTAELLHDGWAVASEDAIP
jgi:hypothetical protein